MQSRIPISALIISLCASLFAADYQVANKAGAYENERATMPYSLWTNSLLWVTAESPWLGTGTNKAAVCYAKTCSGQLIQQIEASQPERTTTNGLTSFKFDGVDDFIASPLSSATFDAQWTISAWIRHQGDMPAMRIIVHKPGAAQGNDRGSLGITGTSVGLTGGVLFITTNNITVASNELAHVVVTYNRTGTVVSHYKNGILIYSGVADTIIGTGNGPGVNIGCFSRTSPASLYKGELFAVAIFPTALSSNNVFALYNSQKKRMGL